LEWRRVSAALISAVSVISSTSFVWLKAAKLKSGREQSAGPSEVLARASQSCFLPAFDSDRGTKD